MAIIHKKLFSTTGSFTVPAGVTTISVRGCGGGGGGGGGGNQFDTSGANTFVLKDNLPGAGGGGSKTDTILLDVTPGENLTITVGTGGVGGAPGSLAGQNGNDTIVVALSGTIRFSGAAGGGGIPTLWSSLAGGTFGALVPGGYPVKAFDIRPTIVFSPTGNVATAASGAIFFGNQYIDPPRANEGGWATKVAPIDPPQQGIRGLYGTNADFLFCNGGNSARFTGGPKGFTPTAIRVNFNLNITLGGGGGGAGDSGNGGTGGFGGAYPSGPAHVSVSGIINTFFTGAGGTGYTGGLYGGGGGGGGGGGLGPSGGGVATGGKGGTGGPGFVEISWVS